MLRFRNYLSILFPTFVVVSSFALTVHTAAALQTGLEAGAHFELVLQLGSDDFSERQNAETLLQEVGGEALPDLRIGETHTDNEVRMRSTRLILSIQRADYQRRVLQFLDSEDRDADFGFGGWKFYESVVGNDITSRRLFITLHRDQAELMLSIDGDAKKLKVRFREGLSRYQSAMEYAYSDANQLAAILLIAGNPANIDSEVISVRQQERIAGLLCQHEVLSQLTSGATHESLKKLVGSWIKSLPSENVAIDQCRLELISNLDLAEFVAIAAELVTNRELPAVDRAKAIAFIAQQGTEAQLEQLTTLLDDKSKVARLRQTVNPSRNSNEKRSNRFYRYSQIRDVALAGCVRLSGQSLSDYEYKLYTGDDVGFPPLNEAGFETDQQRETAMKKWDSGGATRK